jgi:UDP-N-acetylglucosamine 4,6-dehydratase
MRSILVTGGSGSFGKAFARRLLKDRLYSRICIFSRGEHAQAAMRQELPDPEERLRFFIGDVRDQPRLKRAMQGVDVVVHAAALKRIEVGAYNPVEMAKTNVNGAINVVEAAQDAGVRKVVALSTDKACEPCSPYGASKALGEAIFLAANNTGKTRFSICRYGNIWNSAGSIVPTWRSMIERGADTVPVTDLNATRFFMRLEEAVDLVLDTIVTMRGGELIVPPGLPAYRVGDLVRAMGVKPEVRGLPQWEKLNESMLPGKPSDKARRMSIAELRTRLVEIGFMPIMEVAA